MERDGVRVDSKGSGAFRIEPGMGGAEGYDMAVGGVFTSSGEFGTQRETA